MRMFFFIGIYLSSCTIALAQSTSTAESVKFTKTQCTSFYVSPPLKDLDERVYSTEELESGGKERKRRNLKANPEFRGEKADPIRQKSAALEDNIIILQNFNGTSGAIPPDPSGAASDEYYVQAVNTSYRVWTADGDAESNPTSLGSLWPGSSNDGDPIVMFDRHADRWFISQFQTDNNAILIAISTTNNPLDEYYVYEFELNGFPDYPKYSIWSDGYYMSANSWGHDVVVFEREKMLEGDPGASMIALNVPSVPTGAFYSMLPSDSDGPLPPVDTPCYFFMPADDAWSGNQFDHIRIYELSIDWNQPNSSDFGLSQQLEVEEFNSTFTNSWDDIPQPNSSQRLDAIAGIFTYRAQFRRWMGYNTLLLTMVVDIDGNNKGGIRWYELRQDVADDGSVGEWYVYQQSTFAPEDEHNRWLGSAAMDDNGNIAMGYNIGGEAMHASLALTGRRSTDPLGEMTFEEEIIVQGSGAQNNTNRFGDYSHMSLAPDGLTFWFTGEYLKNTGRGTRIASFQIFQPEIEEPEEPEEGKVPFNYVITMGDANVSLQVEGLENNDVIRVELMNVKGQEIYKKDITPIDLQFNTLFDAQSLSTGVYLVRFGNASFQEVDKVFIQR